MAIMIWREVEESQDSSRACKYMKACQCTSNERSVNSDDDLIRQGHGERSTYLDSL